MKTNAHIVVVIAHYEPRAAYIENLLADHLSQHEAVSILTAEIGNSAFPKGGEEEMSQHLHASYQVVCVNPIVRFRQRVLARGVGKKIESLNPTGMVLLGPSALLAAQVALHAKRRQIPYVVIAGENEQQGPASKLSRAARARYVRLVLIPLFAWMGKGARSFIGLTPETVQLAERRVSNVLLRALPYDDAKVYPDHRMGEDYRKERGWGTNDPIFLFQGKFESRKDVIGLISEFTHFSDISSSARLILVGAGNDSYSNEVREAAVSSSPHSQIEVIPFVSQRELLSIMNAADVSIWPNVSAGITQTMGAGVFALTAWSSISNFLTQGLGKGLGTTYQPTAGGLARTLCEVDIKMLRETRLQRASKAKRVYSVSHFASEVVEALSD